MVVNSCGITLVVESNDEMARVNNDEVDIISPYERVKINAFFLFLSVHNLRVCTAIGTKQR